MSVSVLTTTPVLVPQVVLTTGGGDFSTPSLDPTSIYTVPIAMGQGLFRISLWMSVPSGAAGQSAQLKLSTTDLASVEETFSTPVLTPGEYYSGTFLVGLAIGADISYSMAPNGTDSFVSSCFVFWNIEKL